MLNLRLQVLDRKQARLFPRLRFLKEKKFYMAGGTALALHFGHRTSLDFDFYTTSHFDSLMLSQEIESRFKKNAKITLREEDTLFCQILGVDLSFFWYKYPLIKKPIETSGPLIATIEDIAAMKLISITQRPAKRDYIDIFYLLRVFNLKDIFSFVEKKYPNFNRYLSLRALSYFEDIAEEEKRPIKVFDKNFSWEKAKEKIFAEVKKYQLEMLKK